MAAMIPAVLIYDASCPMCIRAREWVERRAVPDAFTYVACQSEERRIRFPQVPESACMEAVQLVMEDGAVYAGAEALPRILRRMGGWRWLAGVLSMPGIRALTPSAYRWVARRRFAMAALVAKKSHGPHCHSEGECR